jgi:glucosamine--fructose-6-phosphate aminotransferase (isomerizing)
MCGIVGAVGKGLDYRSFLLTGLKKLDYRGYDSAGLAYVKNGEISLYKIAGRVEALDRITPAFAEAEAGIAHTRWATHGVPNKVNAHPQYSQHKKVYLVHNGVIENFRALKNKLEGEGYIFHSQTDTEVIADLLESHLLKDGNCLLALEETLDDLEGSYALGILFQGESKLYFAKKASPLLIGVGTEIDYLASDALPMIDKTKNFIDLDDGMYGYMDGKEVFIYEKGERVKPTYTTKSLDRYSCDLGGYPYFMLKEIEESPSVIQRLIDNYYDGTRYLFDKKILKAIQEADDVVFLACGTSYYASLLGVEYMRYLGKRSEAFIGSEWAYYPAVTSKKPVFILITQSGETADLILCQKYINGQGLTNIAITNTKGSTIERKATFSLLVYAGLEVAVAATKSYMAQVALLAMLTSALSGTNNTIRHLQVLNDVLRDVISRKEEIHAIARLISKCRDAFFVGRGTDYDASLECSLKFKEISYVHSEAYPGGELKHGPIALIEEKTPVIGLISDPVSALAMRNNLVELSSRGAHVLICATKALADPGDTFLVGDVKPYLSCLPKVMFGQYLAYYVALEKKLPIDKPRNLAKSVTVE